MDEAGEFVDSSDIFNNWPNLNTVTFGSEASTDNMDLLEGYVTGRTPNSSVRLPSVHLETTFSAVQLTNHYSRNTIAHEFTSDDLWHEYHEEDTFPEAF